MDKELLRSVIIGTGLLIIIGLLVWSYIKNLNSEAELDDEFEYDDEEAEDEPEEPKFNLYDTLKSKLSFNFNFNFKKPSAIEASPSSIAALSIADSAETELSETVEDQVETDVRMATPTLIQFSLIAKDAVGFNGLELQNAFNIVGLVYGSLKIYERLDANRLVDYGVACMMEPGTFPDTDLENFYCPGLVFFMQPGVLDNAHEIFDDYIETLQILAIELNGTILDHKKQVLTEDTIQAIRLSL